MANKTSTDNPPTITSTQVCWWERSLDPWHPDAFDGIEDIDIPKTDSERRAGWMGYDWCGNPLGFIPDGTPTMITDYLIQKSSIGRTVAIDRSCIQFFIDCKF